MSRYMGKMSTLNTRANAIDARAKSAMYAARKANPEKVIKKEVLFQMTLSEVETAINERLGTKCLVEKSNLKNLIWMKANLKRGGKQ